MDSTILVPTKLKDMTDNDLKCKVNNESIQNEWLNEDQLIPDRNLYCLYQMLNEIRTKLLSSNFTISKSTSDVLKHFNTNYHVDWDQLSYHIQSLSLTLNELACFANYITYRYQQEIE